MTGLFPLDGLFLELIDVGFLWSFVELSGYLGVCE